MGVSWEREPQEDPLAPARGIVRAFFLSCLGWLPLFAIAGLVWWLT
jgi:hypothetical protein